MNKLFFELDAQRNNVGVSFYILSNKYETLLFVDVLVFHLIVKNAT